MVLVETMALFVSNYFHFYCNTFCVYKLIRTIGVLSDEKNYFVYYGIHVEHGSCPRQKAKDILPVT